MDKKSIRINFNFNIAKNKNGRNNSHFKTKHYKNKDIDYIEGEIWKPIKDFENVYYVSNKGRIKNIISNSLNNNVENLRWVTIKENNNNPITIAKQKDRLKSYNNNRKIRVVKFKYKDYNNIEIFDSVLDAAKSVNDSSTNISRVCKNNSKVSIPRYLCKKYCFMYENDFNRTFNE